MWLARFSGAGHPLQHQRVDLLIEQRRIRGRVRGGQRRAGRSADTAERGCRARLVRNVAVEYRLLATNSTASTAITAVRVGEASSQRGPAGRLGALKPTAASSASTTTRSGR